MATLIQIRRGTAAEWSSANPILANGEIGFVSDENKIKIGDGTTSFNSLDYLEAEAFIDSVALGTDTTGNYVETLISGDGISISGEGTESASATITNTGVLSLTGTTNEITVSASAGNITLSLPTSITVDVIGNVTGNADTASTLAVARTISLGGSLSGSASFDGGSDITINASINSDSIDLGTDTTGNYVADVSGSGEGISVTGTGEGASVNIQNTGVTSLYGTASEIEVSASSGSVTLSLPSTINADTTGNASTASTLQTARSVSLVGDVSGSASFNGGSDIAISATVADDSHNHIISNVDGLQDELNLKAPLESPTLTGTPTAPTASASANSTQIATTAFVQTNISNLIDGAPGALDTLNELAAALGDDANFASTVTNSLAGKQPIDADLTAIAGLSASATGFLKKDGDNSWSLDGNTYLTGNQTVTLSGDVSGSGTTEITVTVADDSHNHIISNVDGLQNALDAKLDSASYTASDALTKIKTVDGAGSGLDSDLLDGQHGSHYLDWTNTTNKPDPTITLGGDASGSLTLTDLAGGTLNVTVADNSHNHTSSNISDFTESVQDTVGGMVSTNTESGISVTYDDTNGKLNFDVNDPNITLSGDVSGSATMTNLGNVTITTTVADDSHNHIISNVDGLQTALDAKLDSSSYTAADVLTKIKTVDGSTSGLDADLLDGQDGSHYLDWNNTTNKPDPTITLGGDASGSLTLTDLTGGTLTVTVADDSHNHIVSNVDGLQTALDAKAPLDSPTLTGIPTAPTASASANSTQIATTAFVQTAVSNLINGAPGALDTLDELAFALGDDANFASTVTNSLAGKQPLDADLTAIAALAGTSGFLKKTATDTWTLDTNTYLTGNQSISVSGDATGSGTTSISLTLANSGVTANSYGSASSVPTFTVDAKGRITTASNTPIAIAQSAVTNLTSDLAAKAPLASPTFTGTVTAATLDLTTAATATAATSYWVETGSDGIVRPKTLANVRTEIVTNAAVNSAAATTVGTVTSGTWEATDVALAHGGTNASLTAAAGGIVYSTATAMAITSAGTTGQVLTSNGTSAPTWQDPSGGLESASATITANDTATTIVSFSASANSSAEMFIQQKQGTKMTTSKILVMWDGTDVNITEFAVMDAAAGAANSTITATHSSGTISVTASSPDAATTNVIIKATVNYIEA